MGRFYKTSGGKFKDFMYQPDMETAKLAVDAEIQNEAIKQQFSKVEGLQQRDLLQGYTDDYNTHVTSFNDSLHTAIEEYKKTGDKSFLDNAVKQGKADFNKESVYGKQRDKSAKVFSEYASAIERAKKLKGNNAAAATIDAQRYLDGEQYLSTKEDAETFEPQTYKDYVDQQADLESKFDKDLMLNDHTWEDKEITGLYQVVENADGTTSPKQIAKLPPGYRTTLKPDGTIVVVDKDNNEAPEYRVSSAVEFTPALNQAYQYLKTKNEFKGINLPATLNWAYNQNMNSPGWIANERQTYEIKRNLNGGFVKLEDVTDEETLANYKSAAEKRADDKDAELTVKEDMAFNTIVADEKDYLEKRAAQEAQIFIGNKKGVKTSTTTTLHEDKIALEKEKSRLKSRTSGKTPEEVKENLNFIQESVLKDPTKTAAQYMTELGLNMNDLTEGYNTLLTEGEELVKNKEKLRLAMNVEGLSFQEVSAAKAAYHENEKKIRENKLASKRALQVKNEVTNTVNLGKIKTKTNIDEEIKNNPEKAYLKSVHENELDINGDVVNGYNNEELQTRTLLGDEEAKQEMFKCLNPDSAGGCSVEEVQAAQALFDEIGANHSLVKKLAWDKENGLYKTDTRRGNYYTGYEETAGDAGLSYEDQKALRKIQSKFDALIDAKDDVIKEYNELSALHDKSIKFTEDLEKEKTSARTVIDMKKTIAQGTKEVKEWVKWAGKTLLSDISGGDGKNITINPEDDPDNIYTSLLTDNKGSDAEILFLDLDDAGVIEATALIGDKEVRFTFDSAEIAGESTTKKLIDSIEKLNKNQLDTNSTKVLSSVLDVRSYKSKYKENTTIYETDKYGNIQYDETTAYTKAAQEFKDVLDNTPIGGQFASAQGKFIYLSQRNDGGTWSTTILNNDDVAKQGIVDLQELYNLPQEQIEAMKVKSAKADSPSLTALTTPTLADWLARDQVNYSKAQEEARIEALNKNRHTPKPGQTIYEDDFVETTTKDYFGNNVKVNSKILANFEQAVEILKQKNIDLKITDSHVSKDVKVKAKEKYDRQLAEFNSKGYYTKDNGVVVRTAPPKQAGTKSFHTHGQAIDLNQKEYNPSSEEFKEVSEALTKAGFKQHPDEWWHWSIGEFV